jgi:pyridinium-3,5-bisthiocarboxylic acid mononucleotide nickel chelatase
MRIAYLDCFSGISGDMFLGALVDSGVSPKLLEETVAALDVGAQLKVARVMRGGISATKVEVYAHGEKDLPREQFWEQHGGHANTHPQRSDGHKDPARVDAGRHTLGKRRPRAGAPAPHTHQPARGLKEICQIIENAAIGGTAKATAIRVFEALGKAEAEIHHTQVDEVHFHEVGAVDAMVDIVCSAVGAEALGVDEWVCSALNVGGGTVKCAHGTLPVPAPATLKLLQGAPVYSSGPLFELVTPTGAAIVKTLAARFASFPAMRIERAGYGAGTRDFPDYPNVLRLTIGEPATTAASTSREMITVLEASLDDLNPQVLAYTVEQLLAAGALDVFSLPVQMKKGRPGALLTVLAKPEDADRLAKLVFAETTTLGVRRREEQRQTLARRWESVSTAWGPVRIKIASMNGTVSNYAPEYEDCRALAEKHKVPLKAVLQEALQQYLRSERKA